MIGVVSYLLINFYFTRIQSNKAAILALTMNRVGDMGLSIGFFALFAVFGSLDYSTIFSITPFVNETAITIISLLIFMGAMAKSAQLGLHSWLPGSMEARIKVIIFLSTLGGCALVLYICLAPRLRYYLFLDFNTLSLFANFYSLSSTGSRLESSLPVILLTVPKDVLYSITGNLLGDGSIRPGSRTKNGIIRGNARYQMTMKASSKDYLDSLRKNVYFNFKLSNLQPYPNLQLIQHVGKVVTQYRFETGASPVFTCLHELWYKPFGRESTQNKFIKIIPNCIEEMFSPKSLAHWIMEDVYFDNYGRTQTVILCTESFTKEECKILQNLLLKYEINSTLKVRNKAKNIYRIRISKLSMPKLRELVKPYMHTSFLYKLGKYFM